MGRKKKEATGDGSVTMERMFVGEIKEAPYNPRTISPKAKEALRESIDRFGVVQPIVVNRRSGYVVGGHQRLKVLQERGVAETDVVIVDLPPSQEKALNVAMNSPALSGRFTGDLDDVLASIDRDEPEAYAALALDALEVSHPEVVIEEMDVREREFWITVRGPVPKQAAALDHLRDQLAAIEGVTVAVGLVRKR